MKESEVAMRKSFQHSLKALEAHIQHANTLASDYTREYDGACLQMRLSYTPFAHIFIFFCLQMRLSCHLAGALGLIRVLIYKAYENGKTTMSIRERKASIREFYGVIFPSLLQLSSGISDAEARKQIEMCRLKYKRRDEISEIEIMRDEECGICMEMKAKVVLPSCSHSLCMKCFRDWRARSESCPFCRDSLQRMNSAELWMYTCDTDIIDVSSSMKEDQKRLFVYVENLPLVAADCMMFSHDPCF